MNDDKEFSHQAQQDAIWRAVQRTEAKLDALTQKVDASFLLLLGFIGITAIILLLKK